MNIRTELSKKIDDTVIPVLGAQEHICIIDPPGHPNVGDSAILLGELDFFERNYPKSKITFYDHENYSSGADRHIERASVLVMHGGGNFGDIWLHHHDFRNHILDRFRHKKIVQMPQSISFSDVAQLEKTAKLIDAQSDFTFFLRDRKGLQFAEKEFNCRSILCPDMAFAMRAITRSKPKFEVFGLLRTDKEVAADHSSITHALELAGISSTTADWLDEHNTLTQRIDSELKKAVRRRPGLTAPLQGLMVASRRRYANQRLAYGIDLLSSGKVVVTDRLHAHIMSCLLGIPNLVFDSWDGKVSALYDAWTGSRAETKLISSSEQLASELPVMLQKASHEQ